MKERKIKMNGKKKRFQFRGKQILLLGLVALVITAGYYRWTIEQENFSASVPTANETLPEGEENNTDAQQNEQGESSNQSESELSTLRRDRDSARSQSVEEWQKIAQSGDSSADAKREAEKKIATETDNSDKERKIETMVKSKGFEDCFAYVDESGVSVTVKGGDIDGSKVAQIKDIIVSETNVPVRNIRINAL